ncbi:hypothetical protein HU200_059286 [Digitaria exilis]|uniref:CCT-eta n=1 Tax=Digitaria exilis TaxID=1010633 RepID=A0A835AIR4_9POAL|nr:hypothetical protein HU200_059286 [Digitaria exilis]
MRHFRLRVLRQALRLSLRGEGSVGERTLREHPHFVIAEVGALRVGGSFRGEEVRSWSSSVSSPSIVLFDLPGCSEVKSEAAGASAEVPVASALTTPFFLGAPARALLPPFRSLIRIDAHSFLLPIPQQPQVILLKEGTDTSQGKAQMVSNINTCTAVVDTVRTTLGPRGMDKLIHDDKGGVTISNDGATIMRLLDIVHPAAKILVDIARSQDSEVGDGTTTVVLLAGEFLKEAKPYIEDGVHPHSLIRSYRTAGHLATEKVKELAVSIEGKGLEENKSLLAKCAATTLSSKLIGGEKEFFASMAVDAVLAIGNDDRLNMIGIKKVPGGTMRDSFLVNGVAFKKTFSYAGFEQQPKKFLNPKILLLNIELELKSEKENAEISGAKLVLSRLAIGDLATQYFADRDIFCAGRVTEEDLQRVAAATGGTVQTSVNNVINEFIEEAERSLHDAIMIVRRALKNSTVVPGGGAIDLKYIFLQVIPRQLCDNAGFDATDVLNKLRQKHESGEGANYGVDINTGGIANSFANFVWEPAVVKINAINAATEAACLILSVDETVKNPKVRKCAGRMILALLRHRQMLFKFYIVHYQHDLLLVGSLGLNLFAKFDLKK